MTIKLALRVRLNQVLAKRTQSSLIKSRKNEKERAVSPGGRIGPPAFEFIDEVAVQVCAFESRQSRSGESDVQ
jgi:hypothetical protein